MNNMYVRYNFVDHSSDLSIKMAFNFVKMALNPVLSVDYVFHKFKIHIFRASLQDFEIKIFKKSFRSHLLAR